MLQTLVNRDATVYDGTVDDHGTHCAGTIGEHWIA
jgi:subtilisin family serine protease